VPDARRLAEAGDALFGKHLSALGVDTSPLGDVAKDEHRPDDGAIRGENRRGTVVDGPYTIVSAHE
jgi:hypothetical protein